MMYRVIASNFDECLKFLSKCVLKDQKLVRIYGIQLALKRYSPHLLTAENNERFELLFNALRVRELKLDIRYQNSHHMHDRKEPLVNPIHIGHLQTLRYLSVEAANVWHHNMITWSDDQLQSRFLGQERIELPMEEITQEEEEKQAAIAAASMIKPGRRRNAISLKLVVRDGEQEILRHIPEYLIKHMHLNCYCTVDLQYLEALKRVQRVTFGFVKNLGELLSAAIVWRKLPRETSVIDHRINSKNTLAAFLQMQRTTRALYIENPLELEISNLKTLVFLRQVFVQDVKNVKLIIQGSKLPSGGRLPLYQTNPNLP